jgi:steroid delta-isomerase-like uncharacterized protein
VSEAARVVEQLLERWNAHDREGFQALAAEDLELEMPGSPPQYGSAAFGQFFDVFTEAFPDQRVDSKIFGADDWAVEEATFLGTHTGTLRTPAGDIPPTGKRVALTYAAIYHVRDGKVVSNHCYWDSMAMLSQLGLVPEPAQG